MVAGVFENRMAAGMPLQTDPAVVYASLLRGTWTRVIHQSELALGFGVQHLCAYGPAAGADLQSGGGGAEGGDAAGEDGLPVLRGGCDRGNPVCEGPWPEHEAQVAAFRAARR